MIEEHKESIIIKKFDEDTRLAKVLTPLVAVGEILAWFPAVYHHEALDAIAHNKRVVIVVPSRFECLVERFICSWRIVIKDPYHLSMIAYRRNRLGEIEDRWPRPEGWEHKSQTLISELSPLLTGITWKNTVGVYCTDVHTYSPALPPACNHWSLDHYRKVNPNNPANSMVFTPSQKTLDSFQYDWSWHPRPFVAIRTHGRLTDNQRVWDHWNEFLKILEERFEGTVFRIGSMDDRNTELEPRKNFIDLAQDEVSFAPKVSQMAQMDYCFTAIGGIGWLAMALRIPSLIFLDNYCRDQYGGPRYDGIELARGWGTERVEFLTGCSFDDITAGDAFTAFSKIR